MTNPVRVLAEYFTGPDVAHNSMCLQVGGQSTERARRFFAAREAVGVSGYISADEAERAITAALAPVSAA